jgi:integrase
MTGMAKLGWYGARERMSGKFQARWCDAEGLKSESGFLSKPQALFYARRMADEALNVKAGRSACRKPILEARAAFLDRPTKPNTRALNERRIDEFLADMPGVKDTSHLTTHAINQYARILQEAGHNSGGQNHHLKIVRCFTNFCRESKWLVENPFKGFKMPKTRKAGRPLTDDEYARIIAIGPYVAVDTWLNLAFRFGHSTMRRISQVWKLTPADFREPNLIRIEGIKGQPDEWLPLQDEAVEILKSIPIRAPTERYFSFWKSVEAMRNSVEDKARRAGLPGVRFHDVCKVTRVTNLSETTSLGDLAHLSNTSKKTLADNYILPDRARAFAKYLGHTRATNGPRKDANMAQHGPMDTNVATIANTQNASTSQQIPAA